MAKITDIKEASQAVAEFEPTTVRLRDGSEVLVQRLRYIHFEAIWQALGGAAGVAVQALQNGGELGEALGSAMAGMPGVAIQLAGYSTQPDLFDEDGGPQPLTDHLLAVQRKWDMVDVLKVARTAIAVNFGSETAREMLGFFTDAISAVSKVLKLYENADKGQAVLTGQPQRKSPERLSVTEPRPQSAKRTA